MSIRTISTDVLTAADRAAIDRLFQANYRDADPGYLDHSCEVFRFVSLSEQENSVLGFAFGDSVKKELPRMEGSQSIALAGMCCIAPEARRQGLFVQLTMQSMLAGGGANPKETFLFAGRMAHAITYRTMVRMSPNTIPKASVPLTPWQQEVAVVVADLLKSDMDPSTMVCRGKGVAVGYPRLEYTASDEEEALFSQVDRTRGDSLLTMCWIPRPPAGWEADSAPSS